MDNEVIFKFQQIYPDDSNTELTLKEHGDINIYTFHDFCKRAAIAFGFLPESVERGFGKTNYNEIII